MVVDNKFYKGKRVLITGDTGFKGSWLAYWLQSMGAMVYGYALPPVNSNDHFNLLELAKLINHTDGDILNFEHLRKKFEETKPEIVFHLAAQAIVRYSYDNPKLTFDTNVAGSVNLLEMIRQVDSVKSLIFVTSDKCYRNNEWIWGYRENDELGGHDPYSASKAAAEIVFSSYLDSFFKNNRYLGLASVRAGNVIGGGDWSADRIVPDCIRAFIRNEEIAIRNPQSTRPWQHVLEPLSGYMSLAQKLYENPNEYSGSWNLGPAMTSIKTVKELTERIISVFGRGSIVYGQTDQEKHEAGLLHLNCDKAIHRLGWDPVWNFEQTVIQTAEWYKGYMNGTDARILSKNNIDIFSKLCNKQ